MRDVFDCMRPSRFHAVAPLAIPMLLLFGSCGANVGYQGDLPSSAARQTLNTLWGNTLAAGSLSCTPREVELESFVVGPFGPTVIVKELGGDAGGDASGGEPQRHWIPVMTDGDIADLHRRATGKVPGGIRGDLSVEYRKFVPKG